MLIVGFLMMHKNESFRVSLTISEKLKETAQAKNYMFFHYLDTIEMNGFLKLGGGRKMQHCKGPFKYYVIKEVRGR